jgi:hypothetical protein
MEIRHASLNRSHSTLSAGPDDSDDEVEVIGQTIKTVTPATAPIAPTSLDAPARDLPTTLRDFSLHR